MKMESSRVSVYCCRKILVLECRKWCVCVCVGGGGGGGCATHACIYSLTTSRILSLAFVALLKLSSYFLIHSKSEITCVYGVLFFNAVKLLFFSAMLL